MWKNIAKMPTNGLQSLQKKSTTILWCFPEEFSSSISKTPHLNYHGLLQTIQSAFQLHNLPLLQTAILALTPLYLQKTNQSYGWTIPLWSVVKVPTKQNWVLWCWYTWVPQLLSNMSGSHQARSTRSWRFRSNGIHLYVLSTKQK